MKHIIIITFFMITTEVFSQNIESSLSYDNVGSFSKLKMEAFVDSMKVHCYSDKDCEIKIDKSSDWFTESYYHQGEFAGLSVNYFSDDSSILFLSYDLPEQNTSLSVFWHKNGNINTVGFSDNSTVANPDLVDSSVTKYPFCVSTSYSHNFPPYDIIELSFCFEEFSMDGLWIEYGADGQLMSEKHYLHGHRVGKWKYYDDYGQLSKEESYDDLHQE